VEELFQTASTVEWFKTKGRHPIYAGGKNVALPVLNAGGAKVAISKLPSLSQQVQA
jgi:hypothetical protein